MKIVDFTAAHIDGAAALLAAQHGAERRTVPELPARFAEQFEASALVSESFHTTSHGLGIAALAGGRVVGFMHGAIETPDPLSTRALMDAPRAGHLVSHAVDPADGGDTYRRMYAVLAARWVEQQVFNHNLGVAASDHEGLAAWFSLGFGQASAHALRATEPLGGQSHSAGLSIRRAVAGDIDALVGFVQGLYRHLAASPTLMPYLPEVEPAMRREASSFLADERFITWVAERNGHAVATAVFSRRMPRRIAPDNAIWLTDAYVQPSERGSGAGTALLDVGLAAARADGHTWCLLNYLTANLTAARFWVQSCGFRPITYFLTRNIDDRAGPASGRSGTPQLSDAQS